ncbi:MAG: cytochrome c [bacterium]|nr:cytochrome c [bacterium]
MVPWNRRSTRTRPATSQPVWRVGLALAGIGLALGCGDDPAASTTASSDGSPAPSEAATPKPPPRPAPGETAVDTRTPEELVAAGRSTYMANCIACHAMDPTIDGALGPAVAGSSVELLEARIVQGGYPEGYEPKRPSRVMVPLPHLEPRIPELAAYLQAL